LRAVRKGDKVTLTWTIPTVTTDRGAVRALGPTRICCGLEPHLSECGTPVVEVAALPKVSPDKKLAASFTDTLSFDLQQSNRSLFVTYAVEVLNQEGHSAGLSNQVRVLSAATLAPFLNFAAAVTAQGVQLSWAAPPAAQEMSNLHYTFRIYRRQEGRATADKIADLDLQHCWGSAATTAAPGTSQAAEQPAEACPLSYLDQTFEWEKTYFYHGTVVSVIGEPGKLATEVEGDDTLEVKVFADDVFPPAVPSGLQAVFSGSGQQPFIDLIWAPVADVDLHGYNIYRHEEGTAPVKVNKQLVGTPAYRDMDIVSGKNYFYSVSAVDVRANESARSEETSERTP
jgi:hypothetical protein